MIPVTYSSSSSYRTPNRGGGVSRAGAFSVRFLGLIVLAVLALLYIAQASQGATKDVENQILRVQTEELANGNRALDLEALRLQSLGEISKTSGLEPVTSVEHIQ